MISDALYDSLLRLKYCKDALDNTMFQHALELANPAAIYRL